jgi:hypothetical protein
MVVVLVVATAVPFFIGSILKMTEYGTIKVVSGELAVKIGGNVSAVSEVTVTVALAIQLVEDADANAGTDWFVFRSMTAITVPGIIYVVPERHAFWFVAVTVDFVVRVPVDCTRRGIIALVVY